MFITSIVIFLLFIYNIKTTHSGILNPEMLQLNIGQLKISVSSSEKNNDIYVLANENDELVENKDRTKDYNKVKASNFEKSILSKLTGAGFIDQNYAHTNEEDINGSKIKSERQTWKEISEKWKEMNPHKDKYIVKDEKSFEYSKVHVSYNVP